MRIDVCGARGSMPAPGEEFVRYGGHTSCLAVAHDGEPPTLLLDAGSGLVRVAALLGPAPFRGTLLLSHLHWDHTHGLPFFGGGDRPEARVDLYIPEQGDSEAVLERAMSPPHFPITPGRLRGAWTFSGLDEGTHEIAGFSVLARDVPHKGGRTFGFRVADGTGSVAYLPDHQPTALGPGPTGVGEYHEAAMALADRADLLVHDAQYTAEELPARAGFGHAAIDYAIGLGEAAGCGATLLFHHDPGRTDDALDSIAAAHRDRHPPVLVAAEGQSIEL